MSDGVGVAPPDRVVRPRVAAAPVFDRLAIESPRQDVADWSAAPEAGYLAGWPVDDRPAGVRLFQSLGSVGPIGAGDHIDAWAPVATDGARTFPNGGAENTRRKQKGHERHELPETPAEVVAIEARKLGDKIELETP